MTTERATSHCLNLSATRTSYIKIPHPVSPFPVSQKKSVLVKTLFRQNSSLNPKTLPKTQELEKMRCRGGEEWSGVLEEDKEGEVLNEQGKKTQDPVQYFSANIYRSLRFASL